MNNGIEYEKLTQEIYQQLLASEGLTTEVKHNIKIRGKSAVHQVDIYWEYEIAGVVHKVAIECKNYNKPISKSIVATFHSVLLDIGNTNGIIVTKNGFQKGAKEFAEFYGINLIELRPPTAEDWKGRLKVIQTEIQVVSSEATSWQIQLDYDWCKAKFSNDQLDSLVVKISGSNNDLWVYDSTARKLKNFLQLEEELPFDSNKLLGNKHVYSFDDAYIPIENFGYVKIMCIQVTYNSSSSNSTLILDSEEITKAILKDAITGHLRFIKK